MRFETVIKTAFSGDVSALTEAISFWGGISVDTGRIIARSHPQYGLCVTQSVLVAPALRGSSSSASVLAELIRRDLAPAALILSANDPIIVGGALTAQLLYERTPAVLLCDDLPDVSEARRIECRGDTLSLHYRTSVEYVSLSDVEAA